MNDTSQLVIPQVKSVARLRKNRKSPEPSQVESKPIKKYEILHRPFDLKFRGKIHNWLKTKDLQKLESNEILDNLEYLLVMNYFFPVKDKWLNQKEVAGLLNIAGNMRIKLVDALLNIWNSK